MLKNDYLLAKIGVDTGKNEPPKVRQRVRQNTANMIIFTVSERAKTVQSRPGCVVPQTGGVSCATSIRSGQDRLWMTSLLLVFGSQTQLAQKT